MHDVLLNIVIALAAIAFAVVIAIDGLSLTPWRRLASAYPDRDFSAEIVYRGVRCHVIVSYSGVAARSMCVELGPVGIRLSVWEPLRRFFPTMVVPWNEIMHCSEGRGGRGLPFHLRVTVARHAGVLLLVPRLWRNEPLLDTIPKVWHERRTKRV